jgi:heme exporter protein C
MPRLYRWAPGIFWGATILALAAAVRLAAAAPIDPLMGPIQKLFYLHVPIAINTFLAGFVVFIASVAYLGSRRQVWDHLAHSAARITVLNGLVMMITGLIWARVTWGHWWVWSPQLAFSLLLWLLYVVYLLLRPILGSKQHGAVIASLYGIVAFLDVPLIYLSVSLLPDVHPRRLDLSPEMRTTFLVWFIAITMLTGALIASRFSLARRRTAVDRPHRALPPSLRARGAPA